MTDSLDQVMSDRFALQYDELPPPDFADVLHRATRISTRAESRARLNRRLRSARGFRPVLVVLAVAVLVGAGAAIADGFGAFDGIGAVDHPQTGADVIDPATAAYLKGKTPQSADVIGLQLDSARHLGQLPDGQNIYVIPQLWNGDNYLCTVVGPPHPEIECNSTLSHSHPTTIFTYHTDQPPVTFGVALDGVTSVSFQAGNYPNGQGQEVTVPVNDNLWIHPGAVVGLQPVTAHFSDGTTVVEPGQGAGCAAC